MRHPSKAAVSFR